MKNKKVKALFCLMIAFAISIPGLAFARNNNVESVSALSFEEVEREESELSEEAEEVGEPEETPVEVGESEEAEPKTESEEEKPEEASTEETPSETAPSSESTSEESSTSEEEKTEEKFVPTTPTVDDVLTALKYTFRDAWKAFVAAIKAFFKRK